MFFTCESSYGITNSTFYGSVGPSKGVLKCPDEDMHFSYFTGTNTYYLNEIYVTCIPLTFASNKKHALSTRGFDPQPTPPEVDFNDECYTKGGRRPVKFKIFIHRDAIISIQIQYRNVPVTKNCRRSHFEVVEDIDFYEDSFEVLGFTSGSTCSSLPQQINLDISQSRTLSNSTDNENNWEASEGLHIPLELKAGAKDNAKFTGSANFEGSFTYNHGTARAYSTSDASQMTYTMGTIINYDGPGAALVVGLRIVYKVKNLFANSLVTVREHKICKDGGSIPPTVTSIRVDWLKFGNVFFLDHQKTFENASQCLEDSYPQECVSSIKINNFIANLDQLEKAFNRCFDTEVARIPFGMDD